MGAIRRRIVLMLVALPLFGATAFAEEGVEVVVFRDSRVEIVLGHRTEGAWTFLRLPEGEVGVPSDRIREIRPATAEEVASGKAALPPEPPAGTTSRGGSPAPQAPPPPAVKAAPATVATLTAKKAGGEASLADHGGKHRRPPGKLPKNIRKIK